MLEWEYDVGWCPNVSGVRHKCNKTNLLIQFVVTILAACFNMYFPDVMVVKGIIVLAITLKAMYCFYRKAERTDSTVDGDPDNNEWKGHTSHIPTIAERQMLTISVFMYQDNCNIKWLYVKFYRVLCWITEDVFQRKDAFLWVIKKL